MNPNSQKLIAGRFYAPCECLTDIRVVHGFLVDLTKAIGMTPIFGPHAIEVGPTVAALRGDPLADEGGTSGAVILSTSGIEIHTWPEYGGYSTLMVHSCRDFSQRTVEKVIGDKFKAFDLRFTDCSEALR